MKTNPDDPVNSLVLNEAKNIYDQGLTKREYFAIMALQGLLGKTESLPHVSIWEYYSKMSIKAADSLIEELNKDNRGLG